MIIRNADRTSLLTNENTAGHYRMTAHDRPDFPISACADPGRLVEARASALVSIMARRAGAESASLPGIEVSRGTAYAGIAEVKVPRFDH
jgi:hypothetical protein